MTGLATFCRWMEKKTFFHEKTALANIVFAGKTGFATSWQKKVTIKITQSKVFCN